MKGEVRCNTIMHFLQNKTQDVVLFQFFLLITFLGLQKIKGVSLGGEGAVSQSWYRTTVVLVVPLIKTADS